MTTWAPDALFTFFVGSFTTGFFFALRRIRWAIASNLEAILGPCGWFERQRRIFRTMHAFAWCHGERYFYLHSPERFRIEIDGAARLEAIAPTRGLIFVTAHVGHWETASHLMPTSTDREAHVVREEELDPQSQAFMQDLLGRHGKTRYVTHFASDDPRLGLVLAEALRKGHVVALQGDRPRAGGRTIATTLFGRTFSLPAGPAALARAAAVPLVPVFSFRTGPWSYRVCVREPIWINSDGDRDSAVNEATRRLAGEIEWAIRREPYQWFCFREVWPSAPAVSTTSNLQP
jgi:lauroyl/myristoyl acyltransferase